MPCTVVDVQDAATQSSHRSCRCEAYYPPGGGVGVSNGGGGVLYTAWDSLPDKVGLKQSSEGNKDGAMCQSGRRAFWEYVPCTGASWLERSGWTGERQVWGAGRSPRAPKTTVKSWLCILSERGSQERGPGKAVTWFTLTFCVDRNVPHLHCPYGRR